MKKIIASVLLIAIMLTLVSCSDRRESELKYVFLFIGDGMSFNAVQLARDAEAAHKGKKKPSELSFTDFESVGVITNYDKDSFIPDSASSGTSIATGVKTSNGVIAENTLGINAKSIATLLKNKRDMKVGIITTANMNHATPGVFYGHASSRYDYYEIGSYLGESGFDLFIGGEFLDADGGEESLVTLAEKGGYTVLDSYDEIKGMKKGTKYLVFDPDCDSTGMMSFAVDREKNAFSLADYVEMGIKNLDGDKGFFIMCEGGRIDSALHANDGATALHELTAFSDAVAEAVAFAKKHPGETLILVTGDHETGGLSLGWTGTGYSTYLENLYEQKLSYLAFDEEYVSRYKAENTSFEEIMVDLEKLFGIDKPTDYEYSRLKKAWEKTLSGERDEEDEILYSTRTPLTVEATRIVGQRSGIGFNSFVHTGAPVGMWAEGVGSELFAGAYDNTDVYNKLRSLFFK